jgi:hypothetical protein
VAVDIDQFCRELRAFTDRRIVVKELRTGIRKPFGAVRARVRARALAILPSAGGLGEWVARARVNLQIKVLGTSVRILASAGRNSMSGRTDMKAIDRGRLRHPEFGRRGRGDWHTQSVPDGFFTKTVHDAPEWQAETVAAFDRALDHIRRG